jgi:hypothetical protein
MIVGFCFSPVLPQRVRCPLTGTALALAVSMIACSNVLAQDSKPPFSPDEGKLFLRNAAEKARVKQKEAAKTFEEFKKTVTKEPFQYGKYIVNGDTPISTDKGLEDFYKQNVELAGHATTEFAVMNKLGVDIIWKPAEKKALTYCVSNAAADSGGFASDCDLAQSTEKRRRGVGRADRIGRPPA